MRTLFGPTSRCGSEGLNKGFLRILTILFATGYTGTALAADPSHKGPIPAVGVQEVLVVLSEFPACTAPACARNNISQKGDPWCGYGLWDCIKDPILLAPPRNTADQWQQLFDERIAPWWRQTSYGQLDLRFTVLKNTHRDNGWWLSPYPWAALSRGNWNAPPPYLPFVPTVVEDAVRQACLNGWSGCTNLQRFDRVLVINNWGGRAGQANGTNWPVTFKPFVPVPYFDFVATAANAAQDMNDPAVIPLLLHELAHQFGAHDAYGHHCQAAWGMYRLLLLGGLPLRIDGTDVIADKPIWCNERWDIMDDDVAAYGANGRTPNWERDLIGWLPPDSIADVDMSSKPWGWSDTYILRNADATPLAGAPSLLRLSLLPNNFVSVPLPFVGWHVECKAPFAGDGFSTAFGIDRVFPAGMLVYDVHEHTERLKYLPAPPYHMIRKLNPEDDIKSAPFAPGAMLEDPMTGWILKFDRWLGDADTPDRACVVQVGKGALPPRSALVQISASTPVSREWEQANRIPHMQLPSPDLGLNEFPAPMDPAAVPSSTMRAPWPGHVNVISARLRNLGAGASGINPARVTIRQPAAFGPDCGDTRGSRWFWVGRIAGGGERTLQIPWKARSADSLSVHFEAPLARAGLARAAFDVQHHPVDPTGAPPEPQTSRLQLFTGASCNGPTEFSMEAMQLSPGWSVKLEPSSAIIDPGQVLDVQVRVQGPAGAPGQMATLPVLIRHKSLGPPATCAETSCDAEQVDPTVDTFAILAETAGPSPSINLSCPETVVSRSRTRIAGSLSVGGSGTLIAEFKGPDGRKFSRLAPVNGDGRFGINARVPVQGEWQLNVRWDGPGAMPAESGCAMLAR